MSGRSKIVVRVDGSTKLGMGHVARCVRLTRYLIDNFEPSPDVSFAVAQDTAAIRFIRDLGYQVETVPGIKGHDKFDSLIFPDIIEESKPDLIILDCNWSQNQGFVRKLLKGVPIISLHEHNFPVLWGISVAINPSIVEQRPPPGGLLGETHFQGPDYIILYEGISQALRFNNDIDIPAKAIICIGGADPEGLTLILAKILLEMDELALEAVVGPLFREDILGKLEEMGGIEIHHNPPGVMQLLADSDLAVVNGATTMFESMALGVPTIAIPRNPYEAEQVGICALSGAVLELEPAQVQDNLKLFVRRIVEDADLRDRLSSHGKDIIDGRGIFRVGDIITSHLQ